MSDNSLGRIRLAILLLATGLALAGCGSSGGGGSSSSGSAEAQSAATGDIPDNQQFLTFKNPSAGYSILYPQGWARKGSGTDVTFSDKDNSVEVKIAGGAKPTVSSVSAELKKEASSNPTLKPGSPQTVTVAGSPTIHVLYHVQGAPDPVTGKKPTLMVDRYELANKGRVATVNESTPVGVDNVDAYRKIIQSFQWG
jgi:PsbP